MLPGMEPGTGNVCQRGWGSTRASDTSPPPPPSPLQVLPLPPACSLAPAKLGAGMHRSPCYLPSSCSGVGGVGVGLCGKKSSPEEEKGIPCLP